MNNTVILRKCGGFYQAFDDDALIISYLFNYKIINYRCGFPIKSINKIINTLDKEEINYLIKGDEETVKDFKKRNNYKKYLEKSIAKDNIDKRINNIVEKINSLEETNLDELLTIIGNYIYE